MRFTFVWLSAVLLSWALVIGIGWGALQAYLCFSS